MKIFQKNNGFTIIELLVSLFFSSFIIAGLMQNYQNVMRYIDNSREMMHINRKVCLFFNQFERDIMAAFIPVLHKEIPAEKEEKYLEKKEEEQEKRKKKEQTERDKEKEREKKLEKIKEYFWGTIDDSSAEIVRSKKLKLFKDLTFISTNALQVYGQSRERFVRIMYILEKDKKASTGDKINYRLIRKETGDVENFSMKNRDFEEKGRAYPVREHLIADNIKGIYFEYVIDKKTDKKEKKKLKEEEVLAAWGDKDFTRGVVPKYVNIFIICWNSELTKEYIFQALFPILSYPTDLEAILQEVKDDKDEEKDSSEEAENNNNKDDVQSATEKT